MLGMCVISGSLIGLQNTRAAFLLQLLLNVTNMLLDIIFVTVLGAGVEGVALASVIAEYLAFFVGLWVLSAHLGDVSALELVETVTRCPERFIVQQRQYFYSYLVPVAGVQLLHCEGATQGEVILAVPSRSIFLTLWPRAMALRMPWKRSPVAPMAQETGILFGGRSG